MTVPTETPVIDYYVWLMSDWAYLGGTRFVQMARASITFRCARGFKAQPSCATSTNSGKRCDGGPEARATVAEAQR